MTTKPQWLIDLAREFVSAYEALRDAVGEFCALMHPTVQAARRNWLGAQA